MLSAAKHLVSPTRRRGPPRMLRGAQHDTSEGLFYGMTYSRPTAPDTSSRSAWQRGRRPHWQPFFRSGTIGTGSACAGACRQTGYRI